MLKSITLLGLSGVLLEVHLLSNQKLLLQHLKRRRLRAPLHQLLLQLHFLAQINLQSLHSLNKECQLSSKRLVEANLLLQVDESTCFVYDWRICFSVSQMNSRHTKPHYFCAGLRKVTDDMKTKNRADRSGVVNSTAAAPAPEKTSRAGSFAFKSAPPKLELQMGRK
jgi:hypothetical protein